MPKNKNIRFVFNDENQQNSYGFYILTEGINTERFEKNPVMLDSHLNSTQHVLGFWETLTKQDGQLTASPTFDTDDTDTQKIAGKVERGMIKGCSMGIRFNPSDLQVINGKLTLTKCELLECSIVAVPSNANAVRLFTDGTENPLTSDEIQNLCLSVLPVNPHHIEPKNKESNMKVKLQSAAALALGLSAGTTEIEADALSEKIIALNASKNSAELKLQAKLDAEETAKLEAITKQVDEAVKAGQISAEKKEQFVNLGIANPELLTETLSAIPVKKGFSAGVTPNGGTPTEVKTKEDFQNLSTEAQLAFKANSPEQYKQLFTKN